MAVKALQMLADRGELDPEVPRQAAEKYRLLDVTAGASGTTGGDA
jgi:pyruvate dehydrogenase E1 component